MSIEASGSGFIETSIATATAIIGSIFGVQKLIKVWRGSSLELDQIKAMHEELDRINTYNKTLSEELGKVQKDFLGLNKEIRDLSDENQQLHFEVKELTLEVQRLNNVIERERI